MHHKVPDQPYQEGLSLQPSFWHFFLVSLQLLLCPSPHANAYDSSSSAYTLPLALCGGLATLLPFLDAATVVTGIWKVFSIPKDDSRD